MALRCSGLGRSKPRPRHDDVLGGKDRAARPVRLAEGLPRPPDFNRVDEEALKVYFPYQKVLEGMFTIYQGIFGLKFARIEAPYKWVDDLQLYAVSDTASGEPMGTNFGSRWPKAKPVTGPNRPSLKI